MIVDSLDSCIESSGISLSLEGSLYLILICFKGSSKHIVIELGKSSLERVALILVNGNDLLNGFLESSNALLGSSLNHIE